jgi:hypothetical protein
MQRPAGHPVGHADVADLPEMHSAPPATAGRFRFCSNGRDHADLHADEAPEMTSDPGCGWTYSASRDLILLNAP